MWGLTLSGGQLEQLDRFTGLILEENQRQNLTRIRTNDMVDLHFLDSLALAALNLSIDGTRILDLGSGAGFPGIPLAVAYPGTEFTLLDGTLKKVRFLAATVRLLDLGNARAAHGRAEELGHDPLWAERFDYVVARAVAKLDVLARRALPLVGPGGALIAYKSRQAEPEIQAARPVIGACGGAIERIAEVEIPGASILRLLVVVRKRRSTARGCRASSPGAGMSGRQGES